MKFQLENFIKIGAYLKKINERGNYEKLEDYIPFWQIKNIQQKDLEKKVIQYYNEQNIKEWSEFKAK